MAAEISAPDRVYLNLGNVRGIQDAIALNIFIDLSEGSNPTNHIELLARAVGLFGLSGGLSFRTYLESKPSSTLTLEGQADLRAFAEFSQALSERRVESTKRFLLACFGKTVTAEVAGSSPVVPANKLRQIKRLQICDSHECVPEDAGGGAERFRQLFRSTSASFFDHNNALLRQRLRLRGC